MEILNRSTPSQQSMTLEIEEDILCAPLTGGGSPSDFFDQTVSAEGFVRGVEKMVSTTEIMVHHALPIDDFLLRHGMGINAENILVGKMALYGGAVLVAALFLPGYVLVGVMIIGLAGSLYNYGNAFQQYATAETLWEQQTAILKGEEAFAEAAVGTVLLAVSQGSPVLASSKFFPLPTGMALLLQKSARAVCLADDPYFINAAVQTVHP